MIVKCSHCQSILSEDNFAIHECNIVLKGSKIIEVIDFIDVSTKSTKMISAQGIDGILYAFEVVPRKAISYFTKLSDDSYHEPQNRRKVNRTLTCYLKTKNKRSLRKKFGIGLNDTD